MSKYDNVLFLNNRRGAVCTPFKIKPPKNQEIIFNSGRKFSGASGKIWEFELEIIIKQNKSTYGKKIPIIIIESDIGKELLLGRFISGKHANDLYALHAYIVAQLIRQGRFCLFGEIFSEVTQNPEYIVDHEILRSGHYIGLSNYIPGLISQGDDIKRKPVCDTNTMYQAKVTQEIKFSNYPIDIVSEICAATGSSLEAFNEEYARNKQNGKYIIYNTNFISIEAIKRSIIPLLETKTTPIFICDEGVFNIYKQDLTLRNGELIKAGTLIGIYEDKNNKTLMSKETYVFIDRHFPMDPMPDLCGEVGEKNQSGKERDVIIYDTNEFFTLKMPIYLSAWKEIISKAYRENSDAAIMLQSQTPEIYNYLTEIGIITPQKNLFIPPKKKNIEIM